MDFVNRLKPEHLQAFWYFASKINFTLIGTFGSLLWATSPAHEEAEFYKTRLREYRWTLSVSAKRAEFLDYAVQMLDASRAMLNNLAEKPSLAQSQVSMSGVPPAPQRRSVGDVNMIGDISGQGGLSRLNSSASLSFQGFANEPFEQFQSESLGGDTPTGSM